MSRAVTWRRVEEGYVARAKGCYYYNNIINGADQMARSYPYELRTRVIEALSKMTITQVAQNISIK